LFVIESKRGRSREIERLRAFYCNGVRESLVVK
jgi:hypothetical protein